MLTMCIFRSLFIICVPMFLMLSGYLMNRKTPTKRYYLGIFKPVGTYFVCSVIFALFTKFHLKQEMTLKIFITNLLNFDGTKYAWYIEMYLGLYILIPFLNILFNHLADKKQAKYLLAAMFIVCILPSFLNTFQFESAEWWLEPASSNEYLQILPQWWDYIYPIFFYFAGAYLSKYKPNITIPQNVLLLITALIFDGSFNYYRSCGHSYVWGDWNSNTSPTIAITAFLVFTLLLNIKFKKENKIRGLILKTMSNACLFAYLLSGIFDTYFYDIFTEKIPTVQDRFIYAPLMIILVFSYSMCSGIIVNALYSAICKRIGKLIDTIRSASAQKKQSS